MSFVELLLLFAFVLFVFIAILLFRARSAKSDVIKPKLRSKSLFKVYVILVSVFVLVSIYYMIYAPRPFFWFVLFAIFACSSLYFADSSLLRQRSISLLVVVALTVMQSLMPMIQNRGIIIGPDQWRDLKITKFIISRGNFENAPYMPNDYYSVIPLFNVLNAIISEVLGWDPMLTFTLLIPILELLTVLSIYLAILGLTKNPLLSLLSVILLVSIPGYSSAQVIPSTLSISLGVFLLLLLTKAKNNTSFRRPLVLISIAVFVTSIVHPIGVIVILTLSFGILAVNLLFSEKKLPISQISKIWHSFIIVLLISITYWSINEITIRGVFGQLTKFLTTLMTFRLIPSIYSPQYETQGFEIYSFVWALPVAASASFLLLSIRRSRKGKLLLGQDLSDIFYFATALIGLGMVVASFSSIIVNPGASVERYINGPAYLLLSLASSLVFYQLLRVKRKVLLMFVILILLTTVSIGSNSPDNAPFEHSAFGAVRITWTSSLEANTIVLFVPKNTYVYSDHDITISGLANLANRTFRTDISYQTTRNVIQAFKENSFTVSDPKYNESLIVIKTDEIINQGLFNNYINVIYNSQRHVAIIVP